MPDTEVSTAQRFRVRAMHDGIETDAFRLDINGAPYGAPVPRLDTFDNKTHAPGEVAVRAEWIFDPRSIEPKAYTLVITAMGPGGEKSSKPFPVKVKHGLPGEPLVELLIDIG